MSTHTEPRRRRASVTVVDDEENMGKILSKILELEGFHVVAFDDPEKAVAHIRATPPDLVLTDMRMPKMTGIDVIKAARAANASTNVVVMTAYGTIEGAIEAMREGAFDYVTKPFKTDELVMTLNKALEHTRLIEENESLSETLRRQHGDADLIGASETMDQLRALIVKVAPSDAAVLIRGESGTGKELVAKSIHNHSPRAHKRFVAINCASIPETLLESELFGHEKGAFTGADRAKMGLVELAHGGTLFLDEIGELPLALQAKLLRVLQEREIQRVGGLATIPVDIRLLAATNRDLKSAIEKKEFRADLFYRLDVISILLPPLRQRPGDVPILADHFLRVITKRMRKPPITISAEAMQVLERYSFPGNVRELENVIERMVVLCGCDEIDLQDVPADIRAGQPVVDLPSGTTAQMGLNSLDYREAKASFEREYLQRVITAAKGNMSEAARISGISRRHFYEKLEQLGMKTDR